MRSTTPPDDGFARCRLPSTSSFDGVPYGSRRLIRNDDELDPLAPGHRTSGSDGRDRSRDPQPSRHALHHRRPGELLPDHPPLRGRRLGTAGRPDPRLPAQRPLVGEADPPADRGGLPRHHVRPSRLRPVQPTVGRLRLDTFAADLDKLPTALALRNTVIAGFSRGGGEVARSLGTSGSERISRAATLSGVPPYLLKTPDTPDGVDQSVFDDSQAAI